MKKYLIILLALPLIATSCLKDDEDKFDKSASERIQEFLDNTSKVLSEAPNGWVVEYYPSAEQEYGGLRMYMKFDASKNEVTVASEAGASDETAKSYYSFGEDYGPTLNFDTYNKLLHCYSEPYGSVGEANIGWGGDYEFIISSVDADEVVLTGKKSKNRIVLTPAATADWKMDFEAYRIAAATMDEMLSYQLEIGSRVYQMSRDVLSAYNSRHFTINTVPATQVGYIYTTTGIKFYEPLTIDNVTIAEMDWEDGKFVDPVTGCEISQIMTDDTYEVSTSNVAIKSANVTVKPGNPNTYYVIGAYPAADAQTKSGFDHARAEGRDRVYRLRLLGDDHQRVHLSHVGPLEECALHDAAGCADEGRVQGMAGYVDADEYFVGGYRQARRSGSGDRRGGPQQHVRYPGLGYWGPPERVSADHDALGQEHGRQGQNGSGYGRQPRDHVVRAFLGFQ